MTTSPAAPGVAATGASPQKTVAILAFHKVGEPPPPPHGWDTWFYVPEHTFRDHLELLAQGGWEVVDLPTFLAGLSDPSILTGRSALLTFDDGYLSMRTVALPWLQRFGYPAVLFVPTDYVGRHNSFDFGNEPEEPLCDWEDLRVLAAEGVAVQSHAASHRRLSDLSPGEVESELSRSKQVLEERLGRPVEVLAYPYGDGGRHRPAMRDTLEGAGYRAACLYRGDLVATPVPDPFLLPRVAMGPDTDLVAVLAGR